MAHFTIQGGIELSGTIPVRGAKNHVLAVFPAALLCSRPITVKNTPLIEDVFRSQELMADLGCSITRVGRTYTIIPPKKMLTSQLTPDIAQRFRASILFAGPVLARTGKAIFPYPGGCVIGKRSIDLFLEGWRRMGAEIRESVGGFEISAKKLSGIDYTFKVISHTGTESMMLTAALAHGTTVLRNAALEPEVAALAEFLHSCGARITGIGTSTITIRGTGGTLLKGGTASIIPDRIETGSFAILAGLIGKNIKITNCNPEHIEVLLELLRRTGVQIEKGTNWLRVSRSRTLLPVDVKTREYPGFATDHQAPFTILLTQAHGQSMVFETIFEGRLAYLEDLNRMGASITQCDLHRAIVFGPTKLRGRSLESPDIRAGLAFVIAALIAKGTSWVGNIYYIDRGYEALDKRLRGLGADMQRTHV